MNISANKGVIMAIRLNVFSGRDRKKTVSEKPDKNLSVDDVKVIVNRELSNMDTRKTVMSCFDEISATNLRTEAVLNEIKDELSSISENGGKLESTVHKDNLASYRNLKELIEQSDAQERTRGESLFRIEEQNRRTWELILRTDADNKKRFKKLKTLLIWCLLMGILAVLIGLAVLYFNLPAEWRFLG